MGLELNESQGGEQEIRGLGVIQYSTSLTFVRLLLKGRALVLRSTVLVSCVEMKIGEGMWGDQAGQCDHSPGER